MDMDNEKLRRVIVQGWLGMLLLLFLMIITDIVEFGMRGDFSPLNKDPGIAGLWFIVVMTCVNVLTQMFLQVTEVKIKRWVIFYLTVIYTFTIIAHQINHLIAGEGFDIHFILDITHHILGVWASIAAYRWAKYGGAEFSNKANEHGSI